DTADPQRIGIEAVDWCFAETARALITQPADDVYRVTEQGGGMEVRGRKDVFGVAEDIDAPIGVVHENVVVDAEVGVAGVFVLTADLNRAAIGEQCKGLAEPLCAPDRRVFAGSSGELRTLVGSNTRANHRLPEWLVHPLWIVAAQAGAPSGAEVFGSGVEQQF